MFSPQFPPALLGNYFLHTLPLSPQSLQGLRMTVLLHPPTPNFKPIPKKEKKKSFSVFREGEDSRDGFALLHLASEKIKLWVCKVLVLQREEPGGQGEFAEAVPEGPIQAGPTGLLSSQIHLEDAPRTPPGRMSLSSLTEVHERHPHRALSHPDEASCCFSVAREESGCKETLEQAPRRPMHFKLSFQCLQEAGLPTIPSVHGALRWCV